MKIKDLKPNLPDDSGVYFFKKGKEILYIGRATSIKDRVKSYFSSDLIKTRGPLIVDMVFKADNIEYINTKSVLEAIILEANLIKKFSPYYNTKEKDNKSFNSLIITDEDFPRILIVRSRDLENKESQKDLKLDFRIKYSFGPYTDGSLLKEMLRIVRKIIPFRDRCVPNIGKPCFNRQLGLCSGVCTGEISKKEYAKDIEKIKTIFEGDTEKLRIDLEKRMNLLAKKKEFEEAIKYRKMLYALNHIHDISLIKSTKEIDFLDLPSNIKDNRIEDRNFRIEGYDVSHFSGSNPVGVMVVLSNGIPDKKEYKIFNIKGENGNNDSANTFEIIKRRLNHKEWGIPDLIVIDGGKIERNVAIKALKESSYGKINIPVVNVVKDSRHRPRLIEGEYLDTIKDKNLEKYILLANSEAHRFSIKNQKRRRKITHF